MIRNKVDGHSLVIASQNEGKIAEFSELLSAFSINIAPQPRELKIEETGTTFAENARIKAVSVSNFTGSWALADDSGLSVISLNGAPGIFSSRYASSDLKRIEKLLSELRNCQHRDAYFTAAICLAAPNSKILLEVQGRCDGLITSSPRGESGFGYDPIFEVKDTGLTFAEMTSLQKLRLGHRGKAFALLESSFEKLLKKKYP